MSPAQAGHMATETAGERLPPLGKTGIWWFLASEIVTFGGLIGAYLIYFWGSDHIQEPATHLSLAVGSINTLILLTSSLTMVLSHAASGKDDDRAAARWLSWTVLLGFAFLVIKGFEWTTEVGAGFTPAAGILLVLLLHHDGPSRPARPGGRGGERPPAALGAHGRGEVRRGPDRVRGPLLALRGPGVDLPVPAPLPDGVTRGRQKGRFGSGPGGALTG
ncbi:MAG: hypothetical protein QGH70_12605 [Nitrospinota bacterium]|nr:hypothetical protein [Nitrospinota bacterium]